ncbi:MAG: hypothetical protein ABIK92_06180 [Pseudomonadota bacterium]
MNDDIMTKVKDMDKELVDIKLDKSFFSVVSLSDQSDDKNYWFAKTPIERMRHIEVLRRINYGHAATSRLQRVLEYTQD